MPVNPPKPFRNVELVVDDFGALHTDSNNYVTVKRFTWKNQNRVQVQAITYGATVTSIKFPNKKGIVDDVLLGFDDILGYLEHQEYYFGITGRYSNLIKHGHVNIGKKQYHLSTNLGCHHYNGGERGFDKAIWEYCITGNKVTLSHVSVDGEEGYPGTLLVFVTYELTNHNEFKVDIKACSNKLTLCNISNSLYFNLAGHNTGPEELGKHDILINADCYTLTNEEMVPTGEIRNVVNTMHDFQVPVKLANLIDKFEGYNSNLCINRGSDQENGFVVRLVHSDSGRMMEIYSNQHGLQFETGNNFPQRGVNEVPVSKTKIPYLRNGIQTFDLLDEIHTRVSDVIAIDKTGKYSDILRLIKELQKKDNTVHRTSSAASVQRNSANSVKRAKLVLDNMSSITLTSLQTKYIEKIVDKCKNIEEPHYLEELQEMLEATIKKQKGRDEYNSYITKTSSNEKDELCKELRGKKGAKYIKHCALNLLPQNYPDAINNANFPSCLLKPGTIYNHTIIYKLGLKSSHISSAGYI